jgi:drug/metabolite transporter (DMT)-like permease
VSIAVYHTGYKGAVAALATPTASFVVAIGVTCPILWILQGAEVRREALAAARSWRAIVGGALSAASFILMIIALTHADSGRILGVRNSSVGFATLFALWLGERPSKREWSAILLLAVGIAVFAVDEMAR